MSSPRIRTSETCTTQTSACQTRAGPNTAGREAAEDLVVTSLATRQSYAIDRVYEDRSELDSPRRVSVYEENRSDGTSAVDVANELRSDSSEYEHEENCSCSNDSDSDDHLESDDSEHVSDARVACDSDGNLALCDDASCCDPASLHNPEEVVERYRGLGFHYNDFGWFEFERNVFGRGSARGVVFLDSDEE